MNKWVLKDLKYIWHPYTQMKDCRSMPPILIERAKGAKLYDAKGRPYYDTISSWWCNVHGHNHPKIAEAVRRQLKSLDHVLLAGFTHKAAIRLAEELAGIAPKSLAKVFFSDNGSTAVETALKMSFQYWRNTGRKDKSRFLSLDLGYHGDTIGAMSVSGASLFNEMFKALLFRSFKAPSPYCYRCPAGRARADCNIECISAMEKILRGRHREIAAVIIEPMVMAAGGMIIYPAEYLKKAAVLAKRYNVHLILDEVATGFGRTGRMFASEHADVMPDFMCLSKGITSGTLPLGATLTTDRIFDAFYDDYEKKKTLYHGHTYTGNPISCAAASASISIFRSEGALERAQNMAPMFHSRLEDFRRLPLVGDVRHIGMIGAIELVRDKDTKAMFSFRERVGAAIYKEGLKRGIILRPLGNVIYLYLPLCLKEAEVDAILEKAFRTIKNFRKPAI